jgi:hypothetical protein
MIHYDFWIYQMLTLFVTHDKIKIVLSAHDNSKNYESKIEKGIQKEKK